MKGDRKRRIRAQNRRKRKELGDITQDDVLVLLVVCMQKQARGKGG
jgi:hypothetical protein